MNPSTEKLKALLAEDRPRLDEAALLIARDEYPDLQVDGYLEQLDRMAEAVAGRGCRGDEPFLAVSQINHELFGVRGFDGNPKNYYDPRNSYLNQVLDRGVGIPITLSLVYMEIGRRLELSIKGVGLPGHFIVRLVHPNGSVLIDPFNRGRVLTRAHCQKQIEQSYRGKLPFDPSFLAAVGPTELVVRMLRNLKAVYVNQRDYRRALRVCEKIVALAAAAPGELRDLGLLYLHNARPGPAVAALQRYLQVVPDPSEREAINKQIVRARRSVAQSN